MAIVVKNEDVQNDVGYGRTINQLKELFIEPALTERGREGFRGALVQIHDSEKGTSVQLDDEFQLTLKTKGPLAPELKQVGVNVTLDLKQVEDISWKSDLDPNTAKILLIQWNPNFWVLDFDFRYNQAETQAILAKAKQFYALLKDLDAEVLPDAFFYNLWACYELVVDATLLTLPGNRLQTTTHGERKEKVRCQEHLFGSQRFRDIFLFLAKNKNKARYGESEIASASFPWKSKRMFTERAIECLDGVFDDEAQSN